VAFDNREFVILLSVNSNFKEIVNKKNITIRKEKKILVKPFKRRLKNGDNSFTSTDKYRRIPKVTAPVTFGFSRQKGPPLLGSRHLRMAKNRFYGNSRLDKADA